MKSRTLFVLGFCFGCSRPPDTSPVVAVEVDEEEAQASRLVLFVSLEATRADALSCYSDSDHWGYYVTSEMVRVGVPDSVLTAHRERFPQASTSTICGLAETGARFQWALSHAPSTLSSHASMMSGMDPHRHRVPGDDSTISDEIPLLAEQFRAGGWDTIGVVASDGLTSDSGLGRGFRRYVDSVSMGGDGAPVIPASEINRRVLAELDERDPESGDLFLFVEYGDAQLPWFDSADPSLFAPDEIRAAFSEENYSGSFDGSSESLERNRQLRTAGRLSITDSIRARGLYLAQVSWIDRQIGELLSELDARGMTQDLLVVLTSDHGLVLDEVTEFPYAHGSLVDLRSIHVPLVIHGRGALDLGVSELVIEPVVRLMDVPSTILSAAGVAEVLGDGQDLGAYWRDETIDVRPHLAEATTGRLARQGSWSNLLFPQAMVRDGFVLQRWVGITEEGIREQHMLHRLAVGQPAIPLNGPDGPAAQLTLRSLVTTLNRWNEGVPANPIPVVPEEIPTP